MPTHLHERLGSNLALTARLMRTRLDERLAPLGLNQTKWLILLYLWRKGGIMPQKDIADCIGVEGPTVVRALDSLERVRFIERREQPADRRTKDVCLTPEASTVLDEITTVTERFRQEIWAGVSDEDLAAYERVIAVLHRNLNASSRNRG